MRLESYLVFGGGCYGSFYVGQLLKAASKRAIRLGKIVVLDHDPDCLVARSFGAQIRSGQVELKGGDWSAYGPELMSDVGEAADLPGEVHWVPAPLAPHVLYLWLMERFEGSPYPWPGRPESGEPALPVPKELPFASVVRESSLALSHAPGMCPIHCIEPATCPLTKNTRDWEMSETVSEIEHPARRVIFHCRHHTFGVGTIPLVDVWRGRDVVAELSSLGSPQIVMVATLSACHGLVDAMTVGGRDDELDG